MKATVEETIPVPKTQAECADRLLQIEKLRDALAVKDGVLEKEEKAIKAHLIDTLPKSSKGAVGRKAIAVVKTKRVVTVKDWDKYFTYIKAGRGISRFVLLEKRPGRKAVEELWNENKVVPGAEPFTSVYVDVKALK